VSHGYAALYLGDPTAKLAGRLTLNPLPHIDPVGTIVLPLLLTLSHSPFFIGYAKPVPVNPYNLPGKYDEALVAFAGPATNIIIAVIFGLTIRFAGAALSPGLEGAFGDIVFVNLLLAIFNLVPLPPLDGSKVLGGLFAALSRSLARSYELFLINFQRIGILPMILLILLIMNFVLWPALTPILRAAFGFLTGQSL
jgi:Zn-dependent protease